MALTLSMNLTAAIAGQVNLLGFGATTISVAGDDFALQTQNIGTSAENLVVPSEIATPGWVFIKNLDATNYVELGVDVSETFVPVMKLKPGEYQGFRLAGSVTLQAKANTAACNVLYLIVED